MPVILIYDFELVVALLAGGVIGLLLAVTHYEQAVSQQQRYENEIAASEDLYVVAQALLRHRNPTTAQDCNPPTT
jgi:hypothetical protein